MIISFNNLEQLLKPARESTAGTLIDGYNVTVSLIPQAKNLMNEEEKQAVIDQGKSVVFVEIILALLLKGAA